MALPTPALWSLPLPALPAPDPGHATDLLRRPAAPSCPVHPCATPHVLPHLLLLQDPLLCDKCCRRCQNTYGERRRLLLQLLLLQSFKEGMLLGMLTKVLDIDTVFPSMGSFVLNFHTASTSSTPNKSYEKAQKPPLLAMRGQLCMRIMLGWRLLMVADVSHLSSVLYK